MILIWDKKKISMLYLSCLYPHLFCLYPSSLANRRRKRVCSFFFLPELCTFRLVVCFVSTCFYVRSFSTERDTSSWSKEENIFRVGYISCLRSLLIGSRQEKILGRNRRSRSSDAYHHCLGDHVQVISRFSRRSHQRKKH